MRRFAAAAVVLYLAGLAFALRIGPVDVRPLYDGVDLSTYSWINPPKAFAVGNLPPLSGQVTGGAADPVTLTTDDTQASLDFGPDGIAPAGNLHATITPVDPASLAAVAPDATAVGNAYRVEVTVDGTAVVTLAKPKTLRLRQPISGATTIYESADGKAWQKLQTSVVAGHAIASTQHIGYYVIAGPTAFVPALPPPRAAHRSQGGRNLAIVVIGSLGILHAAAWDALRRRRARAHRSRAARRQAARRARSR